MEFGKKIETKDAAVPVEAVFYQEKATLILRIDSKIPDPAVKKTEAERLGLSKKEEFHFTIIGSDTGEEILDYIKDLDDDEQTEILGKIRKLGKAIKWRAVLKNDFFYVQKDYNDPDPADPKSTIAEKRQSIIQMAELEGIDDFYQKLNLLLGKQFEIPLPHITLYTTSTREDKKSRGIGIYSKKQFEELNPEKI